MPANSEPLHEASDSHSYYYRRKLTARELVPAVAVAIGAGVAAFYLATRFMQRTPLLPESDRSQPGRRPRVKGSGG
jgi:hypothetical protein